MLSIITISQADYTGLSKTIDSVLNQLKFENMTNCFEHILVLSGYSANQLSLIKTATSSYRAIIISNKDKSLYNAMNIGLRESTGSHVLFLNGGDEFYDNSSIRMILDKMIKNQISYFRVSQIFKEDEYIRPGTISSDNFSHQGSIIPNEVATPDFDERLLINADSKWLEECRKKYESNKNNDIIVKFALGGVSNSPKIKSIIIKYKTNGIFPALLESLKFILHKITGGRLYYRMLSAKSGYERK
jgi:glycosyltransferase involved in cell wall biosynthesis